MSPAEARKAFLRWIEKVGGQQAAADLLGVHKSTLSRFVRRRRGVGIDFAARVEAKAKIPANAWVSL